MRRESAVALSSFPRSRPGQQRPKPTLVSPNSALPMPKRRRNIDPATCERNYTIAEIEFMQAMDRYKKSNRRPFPSWSEVLEVLQALGYRKN